MARPYLKLGEILLKEGIITQKQLDEVIKVQAKEGGRFGEILLRLGFATEEDVVVALGKQLNLPYVSMGAGLLKPALDQNLDQAIPKEFAIKNAVLPLSKTMDSITCAITDPLDVILIDNLRKLVGCEINPVIATRSEILKAIEEFYGKRDILKAAVKDSYSSKSTDEFGVVDKFLPEELSIDRLVARAEEAPVVKLVDLILELLGCQYRPLHRSSRLDRYRKTSARRCRSSAASRRSRAPLVHFLRASSFALARAIPAS